MTVRIPTLTECKAFLEVASTQEILNLWKAVSEAYKSAQRKEVYKLGIAVGEMVDVRFSRSGNNATYPAQVLRVNERSVTVNVNPGTPNKRKWRVFPSSIIRREQ